MTAISQPKHMSWAETCLSTAIGYLVALATQLVVFPAMGIPVRLGQNIIIGAIFYGGLDHTRLLCSPFVQLASC